MSEATFSTERAERIGLITGPMELAWEQTFQPGMDALAPRLVIVWHSEWMYPHHGLWNTLYDRLKAIHKGTRIPVLVTIFGDTPDKVGEEKQDDPLGVFLRALREDADGDSGRGCGWASLSDASHLKSEAIEWKATPGSALLRLCKTCAALCDYWNGPAGVELQVPTLSEFFQFLSDPAFFRARRLHDKQDGATQGLRVLKWLASHATIPRSLPLNILLVENRPGHFPDLRVVSESNTCQVPAEDPRALSTVNRSIHAALGPLELGATPLGFPREARVYVVSKDFERLKSAGGREDLERTLQAPNSGEGVPVNDMPPFRWGEVDLVLQDIVLDDNTKKADGLDLVPHYFEACPQALVFVLTSLDVESLVGSGDVNWKFVDCLVSKSALATLWYEYRRCFRERFGRMLWKPWGDPLTRERQEEGAELGDRQSLRDLFGCLRRWQLEPAILGHGQGVQEMIDHAHRHISEVWRLADDFLGTFLDNCRPRDGHLSVPERMLFAMSVWLHDIGHRGDDFLTDSAEIRANHAGISEYLLLRNPEAFGIEWLKTDFCLGACKTSPSGTQNYCPAPPSVTPPPRSAPPGGVDSPSAINLLLKCRNSLDCAQEKERGLCIIRKLGLLCRHHQSNAPLDKDSLERMSKRGKAPSHYSRVGVKEDSEVLDSQEDTATWLNRDRSLVGWYGSDVRRLDEFVLGSSKGSLLAFAGLLRMLDALQLSRARVGTPTSIESFNAYLDTRKGWCRRDIQRVEELIRTALPGTKVHQEYLAEYMKLRRYERLLNTQYVHYWRQLAVRDVSVKWVWCFGDGAALRIVYQLDDWGMDSVSRLKAEVPRAVNDGPPLDAFLREVLLQQVKDLRDKPSVAPWLSRDNRAAILDSDENENLALWVIHVRDDVIWTEHESQQTKPKRNGEKPPPRAYARFLPEGVSLEVAVSGTAAHPLENELLILEKEDFE
jgi:hypothetical protein